MRSAWSSTILTFLFILSTGLSAQQKVNPNTGISWPANCFSSTTMVYNQVSNSCTLAGGALTFEGTWNSATTYAVNQVVFYSGFSYVSLLAGNVNQNPATATSYWAPLFAGTPALACPLTNATNICITAAPYNASINGGTTTTTSATTTPGMTVPVVSCNTFNAGNGVLIPGAGTGASNYLGNVVSCVGSTMLVSPATIASVPTGRVVQHDETAAFNAAIAYLASLTNPSGTIWLPDGSYLVNGPLQDTGGANAIIPLPKIPNYTSTLSKVAIEGYTDPNNAQVNGAIITTSQNSGNLFAGYDSSTAGPYPPFTNAELTLKNLVFFAPDNPGIVVVNATNLQALTAQNLALRTVTVPLPSNAAGGGIFFPSILNSYQNHMDNVTIAGFYNNVRLTEHTQVGSLYSEEGVNCVVFDNGTNSNTPSTYQGNSVSVDYLWTFNCTNSIASGTGVTTVNVQNADFELSTGNDVEDTANLLYGVVNAHNPYVPHQIGISGAANLSVRNLWTQGGINFGGPTTPGYGSTVAFGEQGISGTPNVFLTNSKANTLTVDQSATGDHQGTIIAGSVASETPSIFGTYLTAINDSYGTGASANVWQFLAQGTQIANYPRSAAILNSQTGNINFIFTDGSETLGSATTLTWSGFTPTIDRVPDTGISRINPDVVGIGNGTYGDVSGKLEAGSLSIGTTATLPAATTINTQDVCLASGTNCPAPSSGSIPNTALQNSSTSVNGASCVLGSNCTPTVPFSSLTPGTNTAGAMVVGSGSSLAVSGSGTIAATSAPYSGLTGTVTTWNQNTTGTSSNVTGVVAAANGGLGLNTSSSSGFPQVASGTWQINTAAAEISALGLGTMATQNANAVAITGGTINGASVGVTTPGIVIGATGSKQNGDATSTPSTLQQVTSTNSGSTANIPVGFGCLIDHAFVSGTNYTAIAFCSNNGSGTLQVYMSGPHALGSESFAGLFSATSATANFAAIAANSIVVPIIRGNGATPTCSVGAAAGTGATCSLSSGSTNVSGQITINAGTATTASAVLATITWNGTLPSAPNVCHLTPLSVNSIGQSLMVYPGVPTATNLAINVAGSAIPASTTYLYGYGPCI